MDMTKRRGIRLVLSLALAMALMGMFGLVVACGEDEAATDTTAPAASDTTVAPAADADPIEIPYVPWDDSISVAFLWKHILESQGYEVNLTQLEIAPLYAGVANGDLDLYLDAWLPVTHGVYADEYDESWEYLTIWNDNGVQNWTVPDYVDADIQSIPDLQGKADMFGGQIVGIESGAGLMMLSEEAIPGYGLEGEYELIEGSTTAMLAELDRAVQKQEPVVVTLWHPHWAYAEYPLRDLEDPEGILGGAEEMHVVAHQGFSEEYPQVAEWLRNFKMGGEELGSLMNIVMNEYGDGREAEAVVAWLAEPGNQEMVDSWLNK